MLTAPFDGPWYVTNETLHTDRLSKAESEDLPPRVTSVSSGTTRTIVPLMNASIALRGLENLWHLLIPASENLE